MKRIKYVMKHHKILKKIGLILSCVCLLTGVFPQNVFAGYARNLPLPALTGDYQMDIVAVAESQLGYTASKTKETIYSDWAGQPGRAWCSEFIAWCAYKAGIPSTIVPVGICSNDYRKFFSAQGRYYILSNGQNNSSCGCMRMAAGRISFSALQLGDILLTESNGKYSDGPDHTCMVIERRGNTVITIDGNSGGKVRYRTRTASQIHGVCRPFYNLTQVTIAAKAVSSRRVVVRWKALTGVNGYQIYRSTSKNSGYRLVKTVNGKTTSYKDSAVVKKRVYYYRVRAYRICNGKRIYGRLSAVKAVRAI